jgi:hypothetical protein
MAAIDFPTATSNGQTFEADSGVIYTYVGTPPNGFWSGTFGTAGLTTLDGRYIAKNDSNTIQTIQTQGLKFNSGSADTILIDGLNSRIGIGTTSPGKLLALQDSSTPALGFYTGATLRAEVNATSAETSILSYANSPITFNIGGSAETEAARIDSSGRVGIGTTSPTAELDIERATGTVTVQLQSRDSSECAIDFGDNADGDVGRIVYNHGNNYLRFTTAASERLRIDSSGRVGIGTTSPNQKIHIHSTGSSTAYLQSTNVSTGSGATDGIVMGIGDATNAYFWNYENGSIVFATNAQQRAAIDSSGSLLVGTSTARSNTPLGGSPAALIERAANSHANADLMLVNNSASGYYPKLIFGLSQSSSIGSNTLVGSGEVLGFIQFTGNDGSSFKEAARISAFVDGTPGTNDMPGRLVFSTTADGASSPTERMRIDSNGNTGLGTQDPQHILHLHRANSGVNYLQITNSTTGSGSNDGCLFGLNADEDVIVWQRHAKNIQFGTNNGEKARIDSSGEFLVGTNHSNGLTIGFGPSNQQQNGILYTNSSPYTDTDIYGCGVAGTWKGRIKFYTSNNGAASLAGYVDEEGHLALGRSGFSLSAYSQTSGDGQWVYRRSTGTPGFHQGAVIQSTNADGGWSMMYLNKFAWNTGDDLRYIDLYKNGATHARLQLTANGANVELTNQSDYRLKENIETYTGGLDTIKALRVRQFDWISNPSYPYKTVGFIAHEVDEILDDIVTGVKDGTRIDEGGNEVAEYQSLDQSRLVPYLTSALQEAIAKIETLELPNKNPINIKQTTSLLNNPFITFLNNSGDTAGSIIQNGVNSVTYATSSDYRLKDNVVELTAAIPRLKQLAPKRFNFTTAADVTVDGFLAHEAQAVVPEAVTGSHNQVDGDGNPVMQGIDQSKLVPLLTAALQEAIGRIETLETKVATLEGS